MTEPRFHAFLSASLDRIASETPDLSLALAEQLGGEALLVVVDDSPVTVIAQTRRLAAGRAERRCEVSITTRTPTIRALLDGEATVLDALLDDRIDLRGSVDAVCRFERLLFLYLNATVRSPSHPQLMHDYLEGP